jgi:uncharacterized protein (DUF1800 family)
MAGDDRSTIAHLLRRTGFGPTSAEVDAATSKGYSATVEELLDFTGPDPADAAPAPTFTPLQRLGAKNLTVQQRQAIASQRALEFRNLQLWWLARMGTTAHPLKEKLTWFWHTHFATSEDKVQSPAYMYRQNQLLRTMGNGDFEPLTQAVAKDPAMMIWLDTATDKAAHPNENFARECMELFTLGIGNYTEADVRDAARAFTGWIIDPLTLSWALRERQHDQGQKTVLGQTGNWGGEDVIHILVNSPASHAWIVASVWSHFAYPVSTTDPVVKDLIPGYASDRNITNLMRAVLLHPEFTSAQALTGLVKQPIEWTVGALRALGLPTGEARDISALTAQGQVPLRPPNVGGWPQNDYWLTTASSMARLQVASAAANLADLSIITSTPASQRVDAVANLLSVTWSGPTAKALAQVAGNPKALVALALVAPESVLA